MLTLVEISENLLQAEMEILNSDPYFNRVSFDSEVTWKEMRRRNVVVFRIGVLEGNDSALGFWRQQGFEDVSTARTVVNDRKKTVFVMEKK